MSTTKPSPRALGIRQNLRRNRTVAFGRGELLTDGRGNILDRPLTRGLACFGDPIEQLFGRFDEPRQWGNNEPEAHGCAMCKVELPCRIVATERLESSNRLIDLHLAWIKATCHMKVEDTHRHPSWTALAVELENQSWLDANDRKLREMEEAKRADALDAAAKKAAANRRRKKRRSKAVPKRILREIQAYRDARVEDLRQTIDAPNPPLWARNRHLDRLILIADAWQGRETLERGNRKASATAVLEWLKTQGLVADDLPGAMAQRVGEALRRADQLVDEDTWPLFDPQPSRQLPGAAGNYGMHPTAVLTIVGLED